MVAINPLKLTGNWTQGYALDIHTIDSILIGHDEYGHEVFDTKRSEMGELLYRLKYKSDKAVLVEIIDTVSNFLVNLWKIVDAIAAIVPVPPSKNRTFQPVLEITKSLSSRLRIPFYDDVLAKTKETPELKDVYVYEKRMELLQNAFHVKSNALKGKSILLLDDLYRSGATLNTITDILYKEGKVSHVYVLTLTKTRSKI
jgi:predicted amidophosphoribosyltransferase